MNGGELGQPSLRVGEQTTLKASAGRIWGMILRYWYVIRSSWPRTAELIYWPLVQMLMWGFLQSYLASATNFASKAAGLFIGAVLLWDILVRSQLGFAVAFLEDIWSRNLGHLMMSPLRPAELVVALMAASFIKLMVAMVPVAFLAYFCFGFNVLSLGLAFAAFFANLVLTSWALGLVSIGVVLRWGLGAESFRLAHRLCVLAAVLRLLSRCHPAGVAAAGVAGVAADLRARRPARDCPEWKVRGSLHVQAPSGLNIIYFALGFAAFAYFLQSARRHGTLVQMGE